MNAINAAGSFVADLLFAPFVTAPPLLTLLLWSVLLGVLMAIAFRYTSNQRAIKAAADQVRAQMLALKLFKDDLGTTLATQGALFKNIGRRLWHSLPPMFVMIVPFVLILAQFAMRYEDRPLAPGERTVVELTTTPAAWPAWSHARLELPAGVALEAGPVRDATRHRLTYRVRATQAGIQRLVWRAGDAVVEKNLAIADPPTQLLPAVALRPGPSFSDRLLFPSEPGFSAADPVQSIFVHYAPRRTAIFGLDVPWWLTLLVVSMVGALASRLFIKVEF